MLFDVHAVGGDGANGSSLECETRGGRGKGGTRKSVVVLRDWVSGTSELVDSEWAEGLQPTEGDGGANRGFRVVVRPLNESESVSVSVVSWGEWGLDA